MIKIHDRSNCSAFRVAPRITRSDGACRARADAHTRRYIDRESLLRLRETDPRNVHPHVERRNASPPFVHRGGFFLSPEGRREMHSCGNASCHSRRLPRDNKLSGLCIGRKQRLPFICKILTRRESRGFESSSSSRARKPAPSFRVKNDLADNRCSSFAEAAGSAALPFAPFLDRSLCLDRSIALSGESV